MCGFKSMTRTIAVTSARGGVGTTCTARTLAAQLAQRGQRVCLLDAAPGGSLASGGRDRQSGGSLRDLAVGQAALEAVLMRDPQGFDKLAGQGNGVWLEGLEAAQRQHLATCLAKLERYDFVLIDAVGGVAPDLLCLVLASAEVILTVTPQPARLAEGYALLKLLAGRHYPGGVSLLVNRSADHAAAERGYDSFQEAAQRCLHRRVPLLGVVREDPAMQGGVPAQAAQLSYRPESPAAQDLAAVAAQLLREQRAGCASDLRGFADSWLQAACDAQAQPVMLLGADSSGAQQSRLELQQQVDTLSAQIDDLVAEINRLRAEGEDIARLVAAPPGKRLPAASKPIQAWIADRAAGSEQLGVGKEAFPVYQLRRAGGDLLRVALHPGDAGAEPSEPQSTPS